MYNIEAGNRYGEALLGLIVDEYETVDDGLFTIASVLQSEGYEVTDEDIVAIIENDGIELEQEEFDLIASVFDQTDDEDVYNGLLAVAMDASGLLDLDAELEDEDEYENDEIVEEEYESVGSYSASRSNQANFSAADSRVAELEARLATVETFSAVKDRLANINARCEFGVQQGWLPPVAKSAIVANFSREEDMVASFSMLASKNGVDLDTQLHAMEFALEVFQRCGNLVDFNQYVNEDVDPEEIAYHNQINDAAKNSLKAMGLLNK